MSVQVLEPTDLVTLRLHYRIAPFEQAAAAWTAQDPDHRAKIAAAGEEYRRRAAAMIGRWGETTPPSNHASTKSSLRDHWHSARFGVALVLAAGCVGLAIGMILHGGGPNPVLGPIVIAALMLVSTLRPWLVGESRDPDDEELDEPRGMARRLQRRRCCDCHYDLKGLPPGLPSYVAGADVGPAACPECNAPWPLVPPPAESPTGWYPGDVTATHGHTTS